MGSAYRYSISYGPCDDNDWDSFLAQTHGGHHLQSSMWAQVKATLGWKAIRIVVKQEERIVAGVQMSVRRLFPTCTVAIVSKGPVVFSGDPSLSKMVICTLLRVAYEHGIFCLVIQPPNNGETLTPIISEAGFFPSTLEVAPTATIQIDLKQDLHQILAAMKKQTRRDIRHGLSSGVTVREGTEDELADFWRLLRSTGQRQNWSVYRQEYYEKIMQVYGRRGLAKLFFTEYEGNTISSQMLIAFGDTVIAKNSGWSGEFKGLGANSVLEWASIEWAKSRGYRFYDLEGVSRSIAVSKVSGDCTDHGDNDRWCAYKLKFGGEVKLFPQAHILFLKPFGKWLHKGIPLLERQSLLHRAIDFIRHH